MACRLSTTSYYLNQWWLLIHHTSKNRIQWINIEMNQLSLIYVKLWSELFSSFSRGRWLKQTDSFSFFSVKLSTETMDICRTLINIPQNVYLPALYNPPGTCCVLCQCLEFGRRHFASILGIIILVPYHIGKSLQITSRSGISRWNFSVTQIFKTVEVDWLNASTRIVVCVLAVVFTSHTTSCW